VWSHNRSTSTAAYHKAPCSVLSSSSRHHLVLHRGRRHRLQEARSQASPVCGRQTGVHVCGLGVLLEAEMSMKQHITRIARPNCFYHLRRLRQIRRVVGEDVTSQLISAFVLSGHGLLHHSCSYGAESWSLWSRDTSTEAATLVTCRTQNQIQAVYMDASNSQWACTTVLGSVCAVSRWIQSSTRSEVRQHCWLHQTSHSTKFDDWCFSHAGLLPGIPYLTILSLSLTPIDLTLLKTHLFTSRFDIC